MNAKHAYVFSVSILRAVVLSVSLLLLSPVWPHLSNSKTRLPTCRAAKFFIKIPGKGVPVLFLHPYSILMWDKQIEPVTAAVIALSP